MGMHKIIVTRGARAIGFDYDPAVSMVPLIQALNAAEDAGKISEQEAYEAMREAGQLLFDHKWALKHG